MKAQKVAALNGWNYAVPGTALRLDSLFHSTAFVSDLNCAFKEIPSTQFWKRSRLVINTHVSRFSHQKLEILIKMCVWQRHSRYTGTEFKELSGCFLFSCRFKPPTLFYHSISVCLCFFRMKVFWANVWRETKLSICATPALETDKSCRGDRKQLTFPFRMHYPHAPGSISWIERDIMRPSLSW